MTGRKRHLITDTLGNLVALHVGEADVSDRVGATKVVPQLARTMRRLWADQGYRSAPLTEWIASTHGAVLTISTRPWQDVFSIEPRRWVVERTFAWLGRHRRLSKDYEHHPHNSESVIYLASTTRLVHHAPLNL